MKNRFNPVTKGYVYALGFLLWHLHRNHNYVLAVEKFTGLPHVLPFGDCKPDTYTVTDFETTTQTEETTDSNVTTENYEKTQKIGKDIAEKLFQNVAKLRKQSDPMPFTDYDHYLKVGLGLIIPSVHYELKNCTLSGTSKVKSQSIHPVSLSGSSIRQFRGFAQIDELRLSCGGHATFLGVSRPLELNGEIKEVIMRVSLKNYRKSGDVVVDSLTLQRIGVDLHTRIATLVSDVIAKDARQVAASMKVN